VIHPELDVTEFRNSTVPNTNSIGFGVFQEREEADIHYLVENFTAPALARALRVREQVVLTTHVYVYTSLIIKFNEVELVSLYIICIHILIATHFLNHTKYLDITNGSSSIK
jgi:hypothetical protein